MSETRDDVDRTRIAKAPDRTRRQPYRSPVLVEYGPVAKLTQAGGSKSGDAGGRKGMCL